jgi:hypothetical protein
MLSMGGTRGMAACVANCHPATLRAEMRRDPEFANRVEQCETKLESICLKTLREASSDTKHWRAAAWTLERLYPNRYGKRKCDTITFEQARHFMVRALEIVSAELPVKKFRKRIFDRFTVLMERLDHEHSEHKVLNDGNATESTDVEVTQGIDGRHFVEGEGQSGPKPPDTNEASAS